MGAKLAAVPIIGVHGGLPPMCPATGITPRGVSGTVSHGPSILRDNTSVSFAGLGEEAIGSESLFIADRLRDPPEEDMSVWDLARLHEHVWHDNKQ